MTITLDNPDALLLPRDVAEHRHTTDNALRQERWRGAGPRYLKLGRRVYYRAGDLKAWLDEHTVTPGSPAPQRD
ncbi:hypothetical protein A5761_03090 [Mycolicibacterium setense]|uniref:hypothetical protein n=1 Tax=Mycolicibacterium setense TaxID=431269 RepID=UPI0007EA1FE6|nr:hypothetical protein [Mycolicibacterium setense]OBB21321.1 hypothetical protein A5761_03090 [Mycolicibacterium setense]